MNLDYTVTTKINLDRALPRFPNSCRQSVLANAINFYAGKKLFTPEDILEDINLQRRTKNIPPADLTKESLLDIEIDVCLKRKAPELSVIRVNGAKYLNTDLWKKFLEKKFILVANHQSLYCDPLNYIRIQIDYLPPDLVSRLVYEPEFSYQTFVDLYKFYLDRANSLDEGHVDIVLDLINVDGIDCAILANLSSTGNEFLIRLPFNFYKNYLAFDWVNQKTITKIGELPSENEFKSLKNIGFLDNNNFQFIYGQIEIYYPTVRRGELDRILL